MEGEGRWGDTGPELGMDWAGLSEVLSAQGRLRLRQEEIFSLMGGREGSHGENLIYRKHLSAEWLSEGQGHRDVPPFLGGILRETWSFQGLVSSVCDKETTGLFSL